MDILVIGGGPGGYVAAIRAAQLGAHVTLVEKDSLGGTCLNVGCIPTKALLRAGHLYAEAGAGMECGVRAESLTFDLGTAQRKKEEIVKRLTGGVAGLLKGNGVTVKRGTAVFTGPKAVQVTGLDGQAETLTTDKIIIAAGSVPSIPPVPGIDGPLCIDSTGALALERVPGHMAIIGGGVIGMEMAELYSALGSEITVVEQLPEILPSLDREVSAFAREAFLRKGVHIHTGTRVEAVTDLGEQAELAVSRDGRSWTIPCDRVLVAVGRRSAAEALSLERTGVVHQRGVIRVDEHMETNVPGIYAVGDCVPGVMLAHVASAQGEVAAEHAAGRPASYTERHVPACVYTAPELAGVGLTEQEAEARGLAYRVGRFPLSANGRALILNGGHGFIKVLMGAEYGELLGVHMVGPYASELLGEGTLALDLEATAEEIIASIHAHPTVTEALREAVMAAGRHAVHIIS